MDVLVFELFPLDRFADDDLQLFDVERFGDVVERAGFERFDGRLRRGVCGDHDDGRGAFLRFHIVQQIHSGGVGQHEIAEDDVGLSFRDRDARIGDRCGGLDTPAFFLEHDAEKVAERSLVIDDQKVHGGRLSQTARRYSMRRSSRISRDISVMRRSRPAL